MITETMEAMEKLTLMAQVVNKHKVAINKQVGTMQAASELIQDMREKFGKEAIHSLNDAIYQKARLAMIAELGFNK